jgi:hypothetical protein
MNPLVSLAASAQPGERKYVLFAGAGVSKDAGHPTAWDLMLKTAGLLYAAENEQKATQGDIERWFNESPYAKLSYTCSRRPMRTPKWYLGRATRERLEKK